MRLRTIAPFLLMFASTGFAAAQTKISGTVQCAKPEVQQSVPADDQAGHAFSISKVQCNWTKPLEIAGLSSKDGTSTGADEVTGTTAKGHGQHVSTMATGEKFYVKYEGTATLKEGAPLAADGTWSFTGGTGKLDGIKGKGTYKGKGNPDGTISYAVEGEYQLPKK
jgi:hypothetical protein